MPTRMKICALQTVNNPDPETNLDRALTLIKKSADEGAKIITLPEYFIGYGNDESYLRRIAMMSDPIETKLSQSAKENSIYLLAGSLLRNDPESGLMANESIFYAPDGKEISRYRKINMFDVSLQSGRYRESSFLVPGEESIVAQTAGFCCGFSICFDLRFPVHYQNLRKKGADIIFVPSAFSAETGRDHWLALLKARAIETQCYIVAPALAGATKEGRTVYGHSAIFDPWGDLLAIAGEEGEEIICADIDRKRLDSVRSGMPLYK